MRTTAPCTTGWSSTATLPSHPRQIEFARLGIDHTVLSKRKLRKLVEEGRVSGWDDPRMPTLCGLRRRGYTPRSIRNFCERIGVAKAANTVEYGFLEHCLREDLNETAQRAMAVLRPSQADHHQLSRGARARPLPWRTTPWTPPPGTREVAFSRNLWIEADDFLETPVPKYKRLYPDGPECRLKGAYLIRCTGCVKDENGNVTEVAGGVRPGEPGRRPRRRPEGRRVPPSTGWTPPPPSTPRCGCTTTCSPTPTRTPADKNFLDCLNPNSLEVLTGCKVEAFPGGCRRPPPRFQFMRLGYFCLDSKDSKPGASGVQPSCQP